MARCSTCGRSSRCRSTRRRSPRRCSPPHLFEPGAPEVPVTEVSARLALQGRAVQHRAVYVAHSIPESNALIIRTPFGNVLHTGDWKLDPTPMLVRRPTRRSSARWATKAVLALIGNSTNAVREGQVAFGGGRCQKHSRRLIANAPRAGRHGPTSCPSNVARLRAVAEAAHAAGREVVLVGRAMERVGAGRARNRLSRWHPPVSTARNVRPSAARQGRGALHRQPGRAARRAGADFRGRAPRRSGCPRATA